MIVIKRKVTSYYHGLKEFSAAFAPASKPLVQFRGFSFVEWTDSFVTGLINTFHRRKKYYCSHRNV